MQTLHINYIIERWCLRARFTERTGGYRSNPRTIKMALFFLGGGGTPSYIKPYKKKKTFFLGGGWVSLYGMSVFWFHDLT